MQGVQPNAKASPIAKSAKGARRPGRRMEPDLAIEEGKPENAQKMQAHQDDDDAGDLRQKGEMFRHQIAERSGRRAEHDEDGGKSHDEHDRGREHPLAHIRIDLFLAGQFLKRRAGQETQIRRHQRQNARRQEAQHTGSECAEIGQACEQSFEQTSLLAVRIPSPRHI